MKIFIPSYKDPNPFFDEIVKYSSCSFVHDHYLNYQSQYKIVNIHWPEAIFKWKEPTEQELQELKIEIRKWKKKSVLIYTRHDSRNNVKMTPAYTKLFSLIESNCDAFIHLGLYSKRELQEKYPRAIHIIIPHPLYSNSFSKIEKSEARKMLGIEEEALVIFSAGRIRKISERKLVLKAFKSLDQQKKVLISNFMLSFKVNYQFRGRVKLKRIIHVNAWLSNFLTKKYTPPKYYFNYRFSSIKEFSMMIAASDVVFIPRIEILNSGNVFLGLTYEKIVVGPAIGNIKEYLEEFSMPSFDPYSESSVRKALQQGILMHQDPSFKFKKEALEKYKPEKIASAMDLFFKEVLA